MPDESRQKYEIVSFIYLKEFTLASTNVHALVVVLAVDGNFSFLRGLEHSTVSPVDACKTHFNWFTLKSKMIIWYTLQLDTVHVHSGPKLTKIPPKKIYFGYWKSPKILILCIESHQIFLKFNLKVTFLKNLMTFKAQT